MMDLIAEQRVIKRLKPPSRLLIAAVERKNSRPLHRLDSVMKKRARATQGFGKRSSFPPNAALLSQNNAFSLAWNRGLLKPENLAYFAKQIRRAVVIGILAAAMVVAFQTALKAAVGFPFNDVPKNTLTASRDLLGAYIGLPLAPPAGGVSGASDEEALLGFHETFGWTEYIVQAGDSVSLIAARYSLSMGSIIAANNISNVKALPVGKKLRIPNMDGLPYTVKSGDSLSRIAESQGIPLEALLDANDLMDEIIVPGQVLFLPGAEMDGITLKLALGELFKYPIVGVLSSGYGWRSDPFTGERRFHAAIDLAASTGTPIKAAMDGKVASLGYNAVYGNYIILNHGNGFQSLYAHLSKYRTTKGASVKLGERIGDVGSTGYSTGPHLHFAIFKNGQAVNPFTYLAK